MGRLTSAHALLNAQRKFYDDSQFPALIAQFNEWEQTRPLEGIRILDATPVFRNTMCKYAALLAGGADLSISMAPMTQHDDDIRSDIESFGICVLNDLPWGTQFDVILDCAGIHAQFQPKFGTSELTRTGMYHYKTAFFPVYLADESYIKKIETCLGTGESFLRTLQYLNYNLNGKKLLVFGYGKVGRGITYYAQRAGAQVTIADIIPPRKIPDNVTFVNSHDKTALNALWKDTDFAVSATGIQGALTRFLDAPSVIQSHAILANMGVEDEWGATIPATRILNHKTPLNFMLPEPTKLEFIDPTMALHNYGAIQLLSGKCHSGINFPTPEHEAPILQSVHTAGLLDKELKALAELF